MRALDWIVLGGALIAIVIYGTWKGRRQKNLDQYLLANRDMKWLTVAISIMATQASAITFLSTPGQAYADGMRFVQFYLGLPIAMVILAITAVPIYHRLKVYTAYEYLERRFDLKTRTVASILFLIQRGVSTGITIYAPALVISVLLGWNIYLMNVVIGVLVVIYTASGGTKAVSWTHVQQMIIILGGMAVALFMVIRDLPSGVTFTDAVFVAGKMGRLNAIDFSFDLNNRYNFWSGLIGGMFVALSYFGTDQSQVQRYLTGESITESRLGLLFNGLMKVPMQFFILFVGAMVFVFYQFVAPPVFFNPVQTKKVYDSPVGAEFRNLEQQHVAAATAKQQEVRALVAARHSGDRSAIDAATTRVDAAAERQAKVRSQAIEVMKRSGTGADTNDTNYVFLTFVIRFLPAGLVGLVLAAIFSASMSSTAAGLNSLASTTVIDIYRRMIKREGTQEEYVRAGKIFTIAWGVFCVAVAQFANRVGTLVEFVNILGSLFYGTILGIFLLAFYFKKVNGTATCIGAAVAEAVVVYCWLGTGISWLWYNVVGCFVVIAVALIVTPLLPRPQAATT